MARDDWEERRLCPDGACIGIIGANGRCTKCGRKDEGSASAPAPAIADEEPDDLEVPALATADAEDAWDDDERVLCPDGSCTGLIGSDGKCKECGQLARS